MGEILDGMPNMILRRNIYVQPIGASIKYVRKTWHLYLKYASAGSEAQCQAGTPTASIALATAPWNGQPPPLFPRGPAPSLTTCATSENGSSFSGGLQFL